MSSKYDNLLNAILGESSPDPNEGNDHVKDEPLNDDGFTQYTTMGGGYTPATKTLSALPSGIYKPAFTAQGQLIFMPQRTVTDGLIEFPDCASESILAEVAKFWTLKEKFKEFKYSHKRGVLLCGPPAGGKSSTIAIIIKKMVKSGGLVIFADNPSALALALSAMRMVEPDRPAVIIWEDLDAVIKTFGESQVLAVLDGESQVANVLFIATTNYPEDLEERITNRPSRFDRIQVIGMPSAAARKMYLEIKLGKTEHEGVDLVAETDGMSIAHLRELIVAVFCLDNEVRETITRLRGMSKGPKSANFKSTGKTGFGT